MAASAVAHQTICWPQVCKRQPKIYCVVCGLYKKPSRQGKKLHKCIVKECKNHIHADCNAGSSSFDCTLANLALMRKLEGSVKEKITFETDNADLQYKKLDDKEFIEISECNRLKLQENNESNKPFKESEDIIHLNDKETTAVQMYQTDINNNKVCVESHQHRKEHKRKYFISNDKATVDDISSVKSHKYKMKEEQNCKDSNIKSAQHRKEHKRKSLSDLENTANPIIYTEKTESFGVNITKYFEVEDLNDKPKNDCDIFIKQLHYDQQYGYVGKFCDDTDIEISETDYEEPYMELLEQLYFKGYVTDRSRKKYMRKWRKHKKKRKRICKKINHFPVVSPKIEEIENEYEQDIANVIVGNSTNNKHDDASDARYDDMYNELYDEYKYSRNNPQGEKFIELIRENNERNTQPFELPQITYIIDNTDPDVYIPPDHYFD